MARSRTRRNRSQFVVWDESTNTATPTMDQPVIHPESDPTTKDGSLDNPPTPVVAVEPVEPEPLTQIKEDGDIYWINEAGQLHRTLGPAVIFANGTKVWYQHGKHHRLDGPALDSGSGYQAWYRNGLRHRVGGPAVTWLGGEVEYWLDGVRVTQQEAEKATGTQDFATSTTTTRNDDNEH